ncbi:MAG: hypothetical protein AAGF89_03265 [Bacteroidota bacterium]
MNKTNLLSTLQQLPAEFNLQEMEVILQRMPHLPAPQSLTFWTAWKSVFLKFLSSLGLVGLLIFCWWQFNTSSSTAEVVAMNQPPAKMPDSDKTSTALLLSPIPSTEETVADAPSTPIPKPATPTSSVKTDLAHVRRAQWPPAAAPEAPRSSVTVSATTQEPDMEEVTSNRGLPAPNQTYPFPPTFPRELPVTTPDTVIKKGLFGDYVVNENAHDFSEIPLAKLRRVLRKNLLRDGLISSKKDTVKLHLAPNTIYLNGEELMPDKVLIYRKIAQDFQLGEGPKRYVYITPKGIAVGDFGPTSFRGSSLGSYSLIKME